MLKIQTEAFYPPGDLKTVKYTSWSLVPVRPMHSFWNSSNCSISFVYKASADLGIVCFNCWQNTVNIQVLVAVFLF